MSTSKTDDVSHSLDDVIINLQKTFSRISEKSATVPEHRARALVTGIVNFEISTRINSEDDKLVISKTGDIQLSLKGTLETDIEDVI